MKLNNMKSLWCAIFILLIWFVHTDTNAQVVINTAEKFTVGNTYTYWKADTTNFSSGASGKNVVWDFSSLQKLQAEDNGQVILPSQTQHPNTFPKANEVRKVGNRSLFLERKTDTVYMRGFIQTSPDIEITYEKPQLFAINPIKYGDSVITSSLYTYQFGNQNFVGGGRYAMYVDGEGQLILNGATYNNVLRVRIEQNNSDTIKPFNTIVSNTIVTSYKWYNQYSGLPILTVDSVSVTSQAGTQNNVEVQGLETPFGAVSVNEVTSQQPMATISQNLLIIEGINDDNLQQVEVYTITGKLVAKGKTPVVKLHKVAEAGELYLVNIKTQQKIHTLKLGVR